MAEPVATLVLAGGAGRRMGGADKAALVVGGTTLLDRVLVAARPLCDVLVVVGPVRATTVPGVRFVQEPDPGGGPVPAVAAGLAAVPGAGVVFVLATDLPLLATADLRRLLAALVGAGDDVGAAAADDVGGPNPLLAAYAAAGLRERAAVLEAGTRAGALLPAGVVTVDLGHATLNVNRPDDLAAAEYELARGGGATLGRAGRTGSGGDGMSATFSDRLARAMALEITEEEQEAVLELARIVAHGSERMFAPLSTFLAGQFVATLAATGVPRADALAEAVAVARRVLDAPL